MNNSFKSIIAGFFLLMLLMLLSLLYEYSFPLVME